MILTILLNLLGKTVNKNEMHVKGVACIVNDSCDFTSSAFKHVFCIPTIIMWKQIDRFDDEQWKAKDHYINALW